MDPNDKDDLLRNTIDSSLDMIQVFKAVRDEDGGIIDFVWILNNKASERCYGNVIGKSLLALNPGVIKEGIFDTFKKVVATGQPDQTVRRYVHEQFDGWFLQSAVKQGDGVATTTKDITDIKKAERQLTTAKENLRATLDSSFYIVQAFNAVRNESGRIVDFTWVMNNQRAIDQNGDVIGNSLLEKNPGIVESGLFDQFVQVTETGIPVDQEQYYSREQFHEQWFHKTLVKMGDGFVMNTEDISPRKKAEQEILEKQALLESVLDNTDSSIMSLKPVPNDDGAIADFEYVYTNDQALKSVMRDSLTGKRMTEEFPEVKDSDLLRKYIAVAETGESFKGEVNIDPSAYPVWVQVSAQKFADGILITYFDITERKRREQRQEYLLGLDEALRLPADPVEAQRVAMQLLGEHLQADRVVYSDINVDQDYFEIIDNYATGSVQKITGRYPYSAFGAASEKNKNGETLIIHSVNEVVVDDKEKQQFFAMNVQAVVAVPLIKDGKLVMNLSVHQTVPRQWKENEIILIQDTAERTWMAVERARAEVALQASEKRFQSIANLVPDLLWDSEPCGSTNWYNDRWLEYTGQRFEEAIGWGWVEAIHPDDREASAKRYAKSVKTGEPLRQEHRVRRSDGEYRWFMVNALPVIDKNGKVIKMYGTATDIHDRKRAEDALRESEQRLQQAISIPTVGVIFFNLDGVIHDANDAFCRMSGYTKEEFNANKVRWDRVTPPEFMQATLQSREELLTVGENTPYQKQYIRPDGSRWWGLFAGKRLSENECVEFVVDISRQKEYEDELRQFTAELEKMIGQRTQELRESRDQLRSILDTTLVQMSILKAVRSDEGEIIDLEIVAVNHELEKETGRTDLVGKLYAVEYPGIKETPLFDLIVKAIETGEPQSIEYFYPHEGFNKWFSCGFIKLEDGVVATNMDITARKEAEEERFNNYLLLRQSEELALLGSWDYNRLTGTSTWSDGMYRLFDLEKGEEVQPEIYLHYATKAGRPAANRVVQHIRNGDENFEETLEIEVEGKIKILHLKATIVRNDEGHTERVLGVDLDITAMRAAEERIRKMEADQQREIFEVSLSTLEEERYRISESLHNGIGQILYGIKINLNGFRQDIPPADFLENKAYVSKLLTDAIKETRRISHDLMPTTLEQFGLKSAIDDICAQLSNGTKFNCHISGLHRRIEKYLELAVYRIAQELMTNVVKHAKATQCEVVIVINPKEIRIRVADNGHGIEFVPTRKKGIGLAAIRSKVRLLNGDVYINSAPGQGTTIEVIIPKPKTVKRNF